MKSIATHCSLARFHVLPKSDQITSSLSLMTKVVKRLAKVSSHETTEQRYKRHALVSRTSSLGRLRGRGGSNLTELVRRSRETIAVDRGGVD
jgi:hypothetical protein